MNKNKQTPTLGNPENTMSATNARAPQGAPIGH